MKKLIIIIIITLGCSASYLLSQTRTNNKPPASTNAVKGSSKDISTVQNIPAQAQYSEMFKIINLDFNRRTDYAGKGEILETQFTLKNLTDDPMDLYLFVIATYEKIEKINSSLNMPTPKKEKLRSFAAYPDSIENFKYTDPGKEGKTILLKFPKNPKEGVNPNTGKPYRLTDRINIFTTHLNKYSNNYIFFNEVTILIFDTEGKPLFRQLYSIRGIRK